MFRQHLPNVWCLIGVAKLFQARTVCCHGNNLLECEKKRVEIIGTHQRAVSSSRGVPPNGQTDRQTDTQSYTPPSIFRKPHKRTIQVRWLLEKLLQHTDELCSFDHNHPKATLLLCLPPDTNDYDLYTKTRFENSPNGRPINMRPHNNI